jgi:hypothetical protein
VSRSRRGTCGGEWRATIRIETASDGIVADREMIPMVDQARRERTGAEGGTDDIANDQKILRIRQEAITRHGENDMGMLLAIAKWTKGTNGSVLDLYGKYHGTRRMQSRDDHHRQAGQPPHPAHDLPHLGSETFCNHSET